MKLIKKTWEKFYYSTFYQIIWEWWTYSNAPRKIMNAIFIVGLCGITFSLQEIRMINMRLEHSQEKNNIEYYYKSRIDELNYQLQTGDKRTPEERRKAERLKREMEFYDFDRDLRMK